MATRHGRGRTISQDSRGQFVRPARRTFARVRALFRARWLDHDLNDEIASHLAEAIDDYVSRGLSPEEARRVAVRDFGSIQRTRESHRNERAMTWLQDVGRDLRHGARLLRRNPLFTFTAAASLAVGIGMPATIALLANGLFLRPPTAVAEPTRLVDIGSAVGRGGFGPTSYVDFLTLRERSRALASVYAYSAAPQLLSVGSGHVDPTRDLAATIITTANYFSSLGAVPERGRLFTPEDGVESSANAIAVVSNRYWIARMGADPTVLGRPFHLNGIAFTIVGIAPDGFQGTGLRHVDVWVPVGGAAATLAKDGEGRAASWLVGGRLLPGISFEQAAAEVRVISTPPTGDAGAAARPALRALTSSALPGDNQPIVALLVVLTLMMLLVLGVACTNVAGVLLARAVARRQEIAVRLSIGAGPGRVTRQLLTETLLLFALGGIVGLILARVGAQAVADYLATSSFALDLKPEIDVRVVAFGVVITLLVALVAGLAPARQASRMDVASALKGHGLASRSPRGRQVLLITQVVLSAFLVAMAGLCVRALQRAAAASVIHDPANVQLMAIDLPSTAFTAVAAIHFVEDAIDGIRARPGVMDASAAVVTPGGLESMRQQVSVQREDGAAFLSMDWNVVESGYFSTMSAPLVAGRDFTRNDRDGAPLVAIASQRAASQFWPGLPPESAVGNRLEQVLLEPGGRVAGTRALTIVGVIQDIQSTSLVDGNARPCVYVPLPQAFTGRLTIVTRTRASDVPPGEIRNLLTSMNASVTVLNTQTLADALAYGLLPQRLLASLAGSLGLVTALLVGIGIYGVTAYTVTRRTREIGVRVALGASRGLITRMVLRQATWPVVAGLVPGLMLATGAARILAAYLFDAPPLDPLVVVSAAVLFLSLAVAAAFLPVRRAVRISALEALRCD